MSKKTKNIFKMNDAELGAYINKTYAWQAKVKFLKDEINKFGKLDKFPIFVISTFLLKCQLVEFELKQLFLLLDMEVEVGLRTSEVKIKRTIRSPEEFDNKTLGQTVIIFCEFDGIVTDSLKRNLKSLNVLRNQFTHHMFNNQKTTGQLISDSKKGVDLANKILTQLTELKNELTKNWEKETKK